MQTNPVVAVVMPAYNEEGIFEFLVEIEEHLTPVTADLAFIVVDDCSSRPLGLTTPISTLPQGSKVTVHRNLVNLGHGPSALGAYRQGLALDPDVVLHVDGDGQFLGKDFPRVLESLTGRDGVVGARTGRREAWFRRVLSRAARAVVGGRDNNADVNTPLRAYPAPVLRRILTLVPDAAVVPHLHFAVVHERLGLDVLELPVAHRSRRGDVDTGTTWQGQALPSLLPSRRLVSLAWQAWRELRAQHRSRHEVVSSPSVVNAA